MSTVVREKESSVVSNLPLYWNIYACGPALSV